MAKGERHPNGVRRTAALEGYGVLGATTEPEFDDIATLAARICATPIALISFQGEDRQWFKARVGTELPGTDLDSSICRHAVETGEALQIPDTTLDPRTADNPLVTGETGVRFYAGVPLTTSDGLALGTLCVIDTRPRRLGEEKIADLRILARQVVARLEMRRALRAEAEALARAEAQAAEKARLLETAETLRLEIDHRVKNSLQLVSSLLALQGARSGSQEVREALAAARSRVMAISSIHAALNQSSDATRVQLSAYAERLIAELKVSAPAGVEIALDADEFELQTSQASSLAILVNEFVTNSLKYAFPEGREGRVSLAIRLDGERVRARFSDDGVGQGVSAGRPAREGLGTRIMAAVAQQLGATLDFAAEAPGTTLRFDFPLLGDR